MNNRHLGSFVTDVQTSFDLAPLLLSRADRNYFSDRFAEKPISAPPSTNPAHAAVIRYDIHARIARLAVEFRPLPEGGFTDVYLTGPAEEVL